MTARRKAASSATFDGKEDAKLVSFNRTFFGKAEAASSATFDGKEEGGVERHL